MTDKSENINTSVIDDIVLGNVSKAKDTIHDILKSKMSGEIEDYKKEFAATMFAPDDIEDVIADDSDLIDDGIAVADDAEEFEVDDDVEIEEKEEA